MLITPSECQQTLIHQSVVVYCFPKNASLSMTSGWNFTKKTVFPGQSSPSLPAAATVCAVTLAGNPAPSQAPSIIPATNAAQFNWLISFGTLTYWFTSGSLSMIMY